MSSLAPVALRRSPCCQRLDERLERPSDAARIRHLIRDHLRRYGQSAQTSEVVVLCIQEACSNALRHSGSLRPADVSVELRGDEIVAVVRDHGIGFDLDQTDIETMPGPDTTGGRGLSLMASLMDAVEFEFDEGLSP